VFSVLSDLSHDKGLMIPPKRKIEPVALGVWLFCSMCHLPICVGNGYAAQGWNKGIVYGILMRIGWKIGKKLICPECLAGNRQDRGEEYSKVK
jgi:hypothetical protein